MNPLPYPSSIGSVADLKQLQLCLAAALERPLPHPDERQPDPVVAACIKPNDRMSGRERLEIYHRQYWFRLLDCLYDDYPGLRALLGERRFQALSRAYLAAYPSESWTLRNLGRRLEAFIAQHPQLVDGRQAVALDMARFEWAQVLAFDEARNPPLAVEALLGREAARLRLRLQPYLSLLEVNHAVDDFFMKVRRPEHGLRSEASQALEQEPKRTVARRMSPPRKMKLWLAVHRCDNELYFKRLSREAFRLLSALRAGASLGAAIDTMLAQADPTQDWGGQLRDWFQSWTALGWFCRT